jgi:hypothetical protein
VLVRGCLRDTQASQHGDGDVNVSALVNVIRVR